MGFYGRVSRIAAATARGGRLNLLQNLQSVGLYGFSAASRAPYGRDQRVLYHWTGPGYDICVAAAQGGQMDVLRWAWEVVCAGSLLQELCLAPYQACLYNTDICSVAAQHGHLNVLQWFYTDVPVGKQRVRECAYTICSTVVMSPADSAVEADLVEILEWIATVKSSGWRFRSK